MGSNQSKSARDPEEAEDENQPPKLDSTKLTRVEKRKKTDTIYTVNEYALNDTADVKLPESSTHITKMPAYSAICSENIEKRVKQRGSGTKSKSLERYVCENEMPPGQSKTVETIKKKPRKRVYTKTMDDIKTENKKPELSDKVEASCAEDSAVKMNGPDVYASSTLDEKQTIAKGIHPSDEPDCMPHAFTHANVDIESKIRTETFQNNGLPCDEDISNLVSAVGYKASKDTAITNTITDRRGSSLWATAVGEEIQSEVSANYAFSGVQATEPIKLPKPNLTDVMLSPPTSNYPVLAISASAFSGNSKYSTVSASPALSTSVVVSSETTNLSSQSNDTQPFAINSAFGNFSGAITESNSSIMTSSATTISSGFSNFYPQSTHSSPESLLFTGNNHGNFSMATNATTSLVPSNRNGSSITPSSLHFNFPSSLSNYSGRNSQIAFTTHTSTTNILTNSGTNYGYSNWNELGAGIETDCGEGLSDEAIAWQLQNFFSTYNGPGNYENDYSASSVADTNKSDLTGDYITVRTSVGDTSTRISAKNIRLVNPNYRDELTDENMGIILERPKYPRYATLASRSKSFENSWPITNKMSWEKLPEAGFVYTGTADCVRCFYCNGGLREWLKNDCPWTEHARYYPHCPHVRQCKGDDFIRTVREGTDDAAYAQDEDSGSEMEVDVVADVDPLPRDQETMRIAADFVTDPGLLERALYYLKIVKGKTSFDAQELVGVALDIEEGTITVDHFERTVKDDVEVTVSEEPTKTQQVDNMEDLEIDGLSLEEENRFLKERSLCKVCLDGTACVLFLDCGHMIACPMCAPALKNCAVCRAEVKGTVRAQFATDG